ncbi:MAG: hypothetical protein JNK79_00170 [Chitinophagaceae bacterium]|nr:hypothetical protein [Chitinophagaceae bacterium]
MKASTERKIIRWMHIILGIPIVGYLYGPVSTIPVSSMIVRWIIFPLLVLSGLWLWKGHVVKKLFRKKPVHTLKVG